MQGRRGWFWRCCAVQFGWAVVRTSALDTPATSPRSGRGSAKLRRRADAPNIARASPPTRVSALDQRKDTDSTAADRPGRDRFASDTVVVQLRDEVFVPRGAGRMPPGDIPERHRRTDVDASGRVMAAHDVRLVTPGDI